MQDKRVALLGFLALAAADLEACRAQEPGPGEKAHSGLPAIRSLWRETLAIAWGWKGPWPLDGPRKAALLKELDGAIAELTGTAGPEAGLLLVEMRRLRGHMGRVRILERTAGLEAGGRLKDDPMPYLSRLLERLPFFQALLEEQAGQREWLYDFLPFLLEDLNDLDPIRAPGVRRTWWESVEMGKSGAGLFESWIQLLARLEPTRLEEEKELEGLAGLAAVCLEALPHMGPGLMERSNLESLNALDRRLEEGTRLACRRFLEGDLRLGECRLLIAEIARLRAGVDWQRRLLWHLPIQPRFLEGLPGPVDMARRLCWLPRLALGEAQAGQLRKSVARILIDGVGQDLAMLRAESWEFADPPGIPLEPLAEEAGKLAAHFGLELPAWGSGHPAPVEERDYPESHSWRRIQAAWFEAEEVAMGRRGDYPYTDRERDRLLLSLEVAAREVGLLAEAGRLSEGERGLLRIALAELADKARSFRTVGLMATCYISMDFDPVWPCLDRIERRLPLLEKLVSEKRIPGEAFARVLGGLTRDLAVLAQLEPDRTWLRFKELPPRSQKTIDWLDRLNPERWAKASARAGGLLQALLPRPVESGSPLGAEPGWMEIAAAIGEAVPAGDRKSGGGEPRPDLNAVDRNVSAARLAASRLAIQGEISWPELQLIHAELEWHRQRLDRLRSRDQGAPRFLQTDTYSSALASTRKLSWAVPFVVPLAREGRIRSAVLEALLPGLRAARDDLRDLADRDRNACARHPAFPGLEERATAAIQELERLLAAPPRPGPQDTK